MSKTTTAAALVIGIALALAGPIGCAHDAGGAADRAQASPSASTTAPPLTDLELAFVGRWRVDFQQPQPPFDYEYQRDNWIRDMQHLDVDVRADRTMLLSLHGDDLLLINWQMEGDRLVSADEGGWPRDFSLVRTPVNDGGGGVAVALRSEASGASAAIFGGGAADVGGNASPDQVIPLAAQPSGMPADPASLAGEWQLNFELTSRAMRECRDHLTGAGMRPEYETRTIESQLKGGMPSPPRFTFTPVPGSAASAMPDDKAGNAGVAEETFATGEHTSYTFGVWNDAIVLYTKDGWHGIKPNTKVLRVIDGHIVIPGYPLVLERVNR
jgi:hypothetical protein